MTFSQTTMDQNNGGLWRALQIYEFKKCNSKQITEKLFIVVIHIYQSSRGDKDL